jgi:nucleobase transporter 1/2
MWGLCAILTATGVFEDGSPARTDVRLSVMKDAPWFRVPYPFQFGIPTVSLSGVLGMLAGVLACTVESISYYPTVAQMCDAPPPPLHAINRGIGTEGLGTVLAGLWGAGNGTNTFGENVGAIGVTKVGSRRVIQWAALLMIIQGIFGKVGAAFIMIPDPVVGGIFCVMFGMICAFGLSALQYVDLRSSRNLYIIGLSLFFPLVLCQWLQKKPGVIQTGNVSL